MKQKRRLITNRLTMAWLSVLMGLVLQGIVTAQPTPEFPEYISFDLIPEGWSETATFQFQKHTLRNNGFKFLGWDASNTNANSEGYYIKDTPEPRTYRGQVKGNRNIRLFMYVNDDNQAVIDSLGDKCRIWDTFTHDISALLTDKTATNTFVIPAYTTPIQGLGMPNETPKTGDYWKPAPKKPIGKMQRIPTGLEIRTKPALKPNPVAKVEHDLNLFDYMMARDGSVTHELNIIIIREAEDQGFHPSNYGAGFDKQWNNSHYLTNNYEWSFLYAQGTGNAHGNPANGGAAASGAIMHEGDHTWGGDHSTYATDAMTGYKNGFLGALTIEKMLDRRNKGRKETGTERHIFDVDKKFTYPTLLPPYTTLDLVTASLDTSVDIPVLENDYDAQKRDFMIHTFSKVTEVGGSVELKNGGILRYTPATGYTGKDLIPYSIINSDGMISSNLVFVEVLNHDLTLHYTFDEGKGAEITDKLGKHDGAFITGNLAENSIIGITGKAAVPEEGIIVDPSKLLPESIHLAEKREVIGKNLPGPFNHTMETGNHFDPMNTDYSFSFWFKLLGGNSSGKLMLAKKSWEDIQVRGFEIFLTNNRLNLKVGEFDAQIDGKSTASDTLLESSTWYHVAMVINRTDNTARLYLDGEEAPSAIPLEVGSFIFNGRMPLILGPNSFGRVAFDDVKLYTKALTKKKIRGQLSSATYSASSPEPSMNAVGIAVGRGTLQWKDKGANAGSFDLFFGTNPSNLNPIATKLSTQSYSAPDLIAGTTYYWRVDKRLSDGTIVPGDVWSFTTRYPRVRLREGLQSWWGFDEALDSGANVYDSVTGQAGLMDAHVSRTAGILGNALNGPDHEVGKVALGSLPDVTGDMSVSFWARKWLDAGNVALRLGTGYEFIVNRRQSLRIKDHGGSGIIITDNNETRAGENKLTEYSWHHIVMTKTDDYVKTYVDGAWVWTEKLPDTLSIISGGKFSIGPFMGQLDEIMIWNRALDESDIFLLSETYQDAVKCSYYEDISGRSLTALTNNSAYINNTPSYVSHQSRMELFSEGGNNYGVVMESLFRPPESGTYTFYRDDNSLQTELYINPNGMASAPSKLTKVLANNMDDLDPVEIVLSADKLYYIKGLIKVGTLKGFVESEFHFIGPGERRLKQIDPTKLLLTSSLFAYPFLIPLDAAERTTTPEVMEKIMRKTWRISADRTHTYTENLRYNVYDPDFSETLTFEKENPNQLPWLNLNKNGTISADVDLSRVGVHTVKIRVTDSSKNSVTFRVRLNLQKNIVPEWTTNLIQFTSPANRAVSLDLSQYVKDPDTNDRLIFEYIKNPWIAKLSPEGLLISRPMAKETDIEFEILVRDNAGDTDVVKVVYKALLPNHPPVWNAPTLILPDVSTVGSYLRDLNQDVTEKDFGDTLSFQLITGPSWLSCSTDGILSGTVPDEFDKTIEDSVVAANDGYGAVLVTLQMAFSSSGNNGAGASINRYDGGNLPPLARGDQLTVLMNTPLPFSDKHLLKNDSDPEGGSLMIDKTKFNQGRFKLGTIATNATGKLVYTPTAGKTGIGYFSYTIQDEQGLTDTAFVTVKIKANEEPLVAHNATYVVNDTTVIVDLIDHITGGGELSDLTFEIVPTLETKGGRRMGQWTSKPYQFRVKELDTLSGTDQFTYTVNNGSGESKQGVITLESPSLTVSSPHSAEGALQPPARDDRHYYTLNTHITASSDMITEGQTRYMPNGYTLVQGETTNVVENSDQVDLVMTNHMQLTWNWNTQYKISTEPSKNGEITVNPRWVEADATSSITAIPHSYHSFKQWKSGRGTDNPLTLTVTRPITMDAIFTENIAFNQTPEWWLARYGLGTRAADAKIDADGDGQKNWEEYIAGTNPTNELSVLKGTIKNIQDDEFKFSWETVQGRTYSVLTSESLIAADAVWKPVNSAIQKEGVTNSVNLSIENADATFMKVQAVKD